MKAIEGKIKTLIADDHTIVRQGIENLLEGEEKVEIVAKASDGFEALREFENNAIDVAIIDISMPRLNGLETARRIKNSERPVKVIILSMYDDDEYIRKAIKVGADGYVIKEDAINELVSAIEQVSQNNCYLSPSILNRVVEMVRRGINQFEKDEYEKLTSREREVLQLIAEKHSNKDIADILSRSVETVRTHRANIMEKLDLHSAEELRDFALQKGIIKEKGND